MDIFEYGKALTDFWTLGGKAFLAGQETTYRAFAETMTNATNQSFASLMPSLSTDKAELATTSKAFMTLWTSAAELSATLVQRLPRGTEAEAATTAIFRKMIDPRAWMSGTGDLDEMLQRMAEGPRLSDYWDVERKFVKVFQAWLLLRRRSMEHTTVVLAAWVQAANKFSEQLGAMKSGTQLPTARELLTEWTDLANRELLETQRSDRFLQTQAELLRASTDLRFAQRDLAEYYGQRFGFPTRTELDDVHFTVTELKREVWALRRELRAKSEAAAPAPKLAAPPAPAPEPPQLALMQPESRPLELAPSESPSSESPSMESPSSASPSMESPSMESPSMESPSMESPSMESLPSEPVHGSPSSGAPAARVRKARS